MNQKLSIVYYPDPRLRKESEVISEVNDEIREQLDQMLHLMRRLDGAGLSAVQVGIMKRMFILDLVEDPRGADRDKANLHFFINPVVTWKSEETTLDDEGCLSFPGIYLRISRPKEIEVEYLDYHGNKCKLKARDYFARGILHELDHLDGVLFADHVSRIRREMVLKKAEKMVAKYKLGAA